VALYMALQYTIEVVWKEVSRQSAVQSHAVIDRIQCVVTGQATGANDTARSRTTNLRASTTEQFADEKPAAFAELDPVAESEPYLHESVMVTELLR